jgi:uncharacterized protein (DUF362 family)
MAEEYSLEGIDRRTFLKIASITGIAGLIYPKGLLSGAEARAASRVILVEDTSATTGLTINADVVQSMVNCGIMNLMQVADVGEAWKVILPGVNEISTIAIKVNCINSSMPTHPEVSYAVAKSLTEMDFGGMPFHENNIVIFDRTSGELAASGYRLNTSSTGVRCFGTDDPAAGYSTQTYSVAGVSQRISRIVSELADYLINISVLKNHGIAGATLCLKNHYGTCSSPGSIHGHACDPYVPALNALASIRDKQALNICDALFGIRSGGPSGSPQFTADMLVMSQDIVAADRQAAILLEENGCTTVSTAHYIATAASAPYNLGTSDPELMDIVNVCSPSSADHGVELSSIVLHQNHPNPFKRDTHIRFFLPKPEPVSLTVYDSSGRRVRGLVENKLAAGWHEVPWTGLTDAGRTAACGVYFCQLETRTYKKAVIMQLVR